MKNYYLLLFCLVSLNSFAQYLTESFASFPPSGWGVYNNGIGTTQSWGYASQLFEDDYGNGSAKINGEDVAQGLAEDWLVTPQFTVPNNAKVVFNSKFFQNGDQGSIVQVRISTNATQSALGNYTVLAEYTETEINPNQLYRNTVTIPISPTIASPGSQAYVAFVMINDNGDSWNIDFVNITGDCPAPTNLSVVVMNPTTAAFYWTETGSATKYYVFLENLAEDGVNIEECSFNGTVASTNVEPNAVYRLRVRANCNGSCYFGASPFSEPLIFSTTRGIRGTVMYDTNGDTTCDTTLHLAGIPIIASVNNAYVSTGYTDSQGVFYIAGLPAGNPTVSLQVLSPTGFPAVAATTVNILQTTPMFQPATICMSQPQTTADMTLEMIPVSPARPGFTAFYKIIVHNNGSQAVSGASVSLSYNSSRMTFGGASIIPATTPGSLSFALPTISSYSSSEIDLNFNIMQPPVNIGGEVLTYNATMVQAQPDGNPANDSYTMNQTTVNSYDPNDITVHQGATILPSQTGDYLTYTIRFQNTGTADAVNIRLENTLQPTLDWNTFRPITASHNFVTTRNGNLVTFKFNDINLPASSVNEPASHGFVTYMIKPAASVGIGSVINNQANIYFDFNAPIITNTATTTVQQAMGTEAFTSSSVKVYPNPVTDRLAIQTAGETVLQAGIYDLNGRLCISSANVNIVDTSALAPGMYLAKITTEKGTSTFRVVKN
mgnify:CR=1 FL=1